MRIQEKVWEKANWTNICERPLKLKSLLFVRDMKENIECCVKIKSKRKA